MIYSIINTGLSARVVFLYIVIILVVMIFSLSIHEYMHGYAAWKLGDDTARLMGRLTLNPLAHLDPMGTLMLLIVGFGWAKPVPVNFGRLTKFKNRSVSVRIVSIAGIAGNLGVAIVSYLGMVITLIFAIRAGFLSDYRISADVVSTALIAGLDGNGYAFAGTSGAVFAIHDTFYFLYFVNLTLAVFNLIPFPPMDGYRILDSFLPYNAQQKLRAHETEFFNILRAVMFGSILLASFTSINPIGSLISILQVPLKFIIETPLNALFSIFI